MNYSDLSKSLKQGIQESAYFYNHTIQKTSEGIILIDKQPTSFKSLSEAKSYIRYNQQAKDIINTLHDNFFSENTIKIANIIKEEHNIKVSNNIIEQYIKIASDKAFSIDPVILKLREMNEYDSVLSSKIHYVLEDNSTIAIDIDTQIKINKLLENKQDVVEFMSKSSDNFLKILDVIIKEE